MGGRTRLRTHLRGTNRWRVQSNGTGPIRGRRPLARRRTQQCQRSFLIFSSALLIARGYRDFFLRRMEGPLRTAEMGPVRGLEPPPCCPLSGSKCDLDRFLWGAAGGVFRRSEVDVSPKGRCGASGNRTARASVSRSDNGAPCDNGSTIVSATRRGGWAIRSLRGEGALHGPAGEMSSSGLRELAGTAGRRCGGAAEVRPLRALPGAFRGECPGSCWFERDGRGPVDGPGTSLGGGAFRGEGHARGR